MARPWEYPSSSPRPGFLDNPSASRILPTNHGRLSRRISRRSVILAGSVVHEAIFAKARLKTARMTENWKTLMAGDHSIWASAEANHLVVNITCFRGLMLVEDRDTETIMERVSETLRG